MKQGKFDLIPKVSDFSCKIVSYLERPNIAVKRFNNPRPNTLKAEYGFVWTYSQRVYKLLISFLVVVQFIIYVGSSKSFNYNFGGT